MDTYGFVYLLRSNQYVSNQYIMDRNPRLLSYTFSVTYSDYIYLLLVCGDCPITLKTGGCWNMLESTTARIPLIKFVHKWNRMLFNISDSKLGIWICSQPIIHLITQPNFYDALTRPYKYLVQHTINTLYKTTCTEDNLHVSFTVMYLHQVNTTYITMDKTIATALSADATVNIFAPYTSTDTDF